MPLNHVFAKLVFHGVYTFDGSGGATKEPLGSRPLPASGLHVRYVSNQGGDNLKNMLTCRDQSSADLKVTMSIFVPFYTIAYPYQGTQF